MMKIRLITSQKSQIWDQYLSRNMKWKFVPDTFKSIKEIFESLKPRNQKTRNLKPFNFQVRESPALLNIPTPTPCTRPGAQQAEFVRVRNDFGTPFWELVIVFFCGFVSRSLFILICVSKSWHQGAFKTRFSCLRYCIKLACRRSQNLNDSGSICMFWGGIGPDFDIVWCLGDRFQI